MTTVWIYLLPSICHLEYKDGVKTLEGTNMIKAIRPTQFIVSIDIPKPAE